MIDLKAILDRMKDFDYSRLVPKWRVDKYTYGTAGIELTWPWTKEESGWTIGQGLGLGIGLGKFDVWAGWPRDKNFVSRLILGEPKEEKPKEEVLVGEIV